MGNILYGHESSPLLEPNTHGSTALLQGYYWRSENTLLQVWLLKMSEGYVCEQLHGPTNWTTGKQVAAPIPRIPEFSPLVSEAHRLTSQLVSNNSDRRSSRSDVEQGATGVTSFHQDTYCAIVLEC